MSRQNAILRFLEPVHLSEKCLQLLTKEASMAGTTKGSEKPFLQHFDQHLQRRLTDFMKDKLSCESTKQGMNQWGGEMLLMNHQRLNVRQIRENLLLLCSLWTFKYTHVLHTPITEVIAVAFHLPSKVKTPPWCYLTVGATYWSVSTHRGQNISRFLSPIQGCAAITEVPHF